MDRRTFTRTLTGGILAAPFVTRAQRRGRVRRIGWLDLSAPVDAAPLMIDTFREGLAALGWIDGQDFTIEVRWAYGDQNALPALAAELVALGVDVIVTVTTRAALAAKNATALTPIVMSGVTDPVRLGLVTSLSRPGGNVTGLLHTPGAGFTPKRIQLLREAAPEVTRLAVLWGGAAIPDEVQMMAEIEVTAPVLGIVPLFAEARDEHEIAAALAAIARRDPDGLLVPPSSQNTAKRKAIVEFALANRLPSVYGDSGAVAMGGLISYYANWTELRRQTALHVDRILRGAKAADLPVERPAKYELVINLRTARALGLTIPQHLLLRADRLI